MKLVYHEHPDSAVREKSRALAEVKRKYGQGQYLTALREVLKTDPWFAIRVAFKASQLDEDLTGRDVMRHICDNWGKDIALVLPRGVGKTWPIGMVLAMALVQNPKLKILQISRTQGNAKFIGAYMANLLMRNDMLQECFGLAKNPEDGFLPSVKNDVTIWGKDGYQLPRTEGIDPNILSVSVDTATTGKHPDIIWMDDPTDRTNNDVDGWAHVEKVIADSKLMLSPHGFFIWTGTRWHDSDPLGRAIEGRLKGKQGDFQVLHRSIFVDDDPAKGIIYPRKHRWNTAETQPEEEPGYTQSQVDEMRLPEDEGGLGQFFDAQMRNDPGHEDRADLNVKAILTYEKEDTPDLGGVKAFGIEITGGGALIFQGFQEYAKDLAINIPLYDINTVRRANVEKSDRIVAALQPYVNNGRMHAQAWMLERERTKDTLGYELSRIHVAAHDDIADALHNIPVHLAQKTKPREGQPLDVYIAADIAWTEKARADSSSIVAAGIDHKGDLWVLDYDHFKLSSPNAIYERLMKFYRKFTEPETIRSMSSRKHPGAWR